MTLLHVLVVVGIGAAAAYLVTVTVVAHRFTTPRRVSPPALPCGLINAFARVRFPARGDAVSIVAWYRAVESSTTAVIMVHGRDGCRGDEFRGDTFALAERFAAAGMSVMMIDLRGHGESDGARLTFGHHECRDVLGAVDFLLARGCHHARIGVFGASMGGASCIAAAAADRAIGAVVTDSTFADLHALLRQQFRRLTRLPLCCLDGALVAAHILTGTNLIDRAPATLIRRLRDRPLLVIHAAADPFVPVQHAHELADAGDASRWITPGARHLASAGAVGGRYADVVTDFFVNAFFPRACRSGMDTHEVRPPQASVRVRGGSHPPDTAVSLLSPIRRRRSRR